MRCRKSSADIGGSLTRNLEPTLEKIVSDVNADNEFPLYKLVNYRRGGSVLESYAATGSSGVGAKEVDKICKEQLVHYMYNGGEGRKITTAECLSWRRRRLREVVVTVSSSKDGQPLSSGKSHCRPSSTKRNPPSASQVTPYEYPEDHEACWILEQRGALGENPLHVLVICDTPTHTKVAKIILGHFPKMAADIAEGREYYGMSPLHLAVAYKNMELVQAFVQAGANVNERALGRFFMPADQQVKPKRRTNYAGLSYLGEYALSWAACCENEAMYNYLLDQGADPNLQDTFGNMLLHIVVISDKLGMYGYSLRHPKKPANDEIVNKAGLTPLALACVLGRNNVFREMLELSSVEFWRFSNITCSAYPLIALDTIKPDGGTNWKSAVMIILNGETDEHLDMLEGGVVQRLLEDKWKTFARNQFLKRLAFLFLHLLVISIAVYLRPKFGESLAWSSDAKTIIRHCAEVGSLTCGIFFFAQQGSEIHSQGLVGFLTNLVRSPAKFVYLISNICILSCIIFRFLELRLVEDSILTFALPGFWFFLMFFAGAVRLTGPFVTMIYSMIAGDMVRFGIIYLIMLTGFSQALFFLFKSCHVGKRDADETNIDLYTTYWGTWMALYHMTLGSYQYSDFTKPKYSSLSMSIFVIFMVLVPILLLNMLIAMMGNTYANVISKSEKEFVKQWAKIVLALERSVSKENAKGHLDTYGIKMAPPPDAEPGVEYKGLMVIKSKSKTKAQQRKGAFINWRRMGKRIVGEMRKYGCKGDSLLSSMAQGPPKRIPKRNSFSCILDTGDSDDEDNDAPPPPKGGLGEALAQLAFTHDLDLAGINSTPPDTPSYNISPSTAAQPPSYSAVITTTAASSITTTFSATPTTSAALFSSPTAFAPPTSPPTAFVPPLSPSTTFSPPSPSLPIASSPPLSSHTDSALPPPNGSASLPPSIASAPPPNDSTSLHAAESGTPKSPVERLGSISSAKCSPSDVNAAAIPDVSEGSAVNATLVPNVTEIEPQYGGNPIITVASPSQPTPPLGSSIPLISYLVPARDGLDTPPPPLHGEECNKSNPVPTASPLEIAPEPAPLPKSSPRNPEVLVQPSRLLQLSDSSIGATAIAHRRNAGGHKSKKRAKSGFPTKIRKLTNKVSAASSFVIPPSVSRFSISGPRRSVSSHGHRDSNNVPHSVSSHVSTFPVVCNDVPDPPVPTPPSLISHPLNRWSTTSLASMASLVAWEDGEDSSDQS